MAVTVRTYNVTGAEPTRAVFPLGFTPSHRFIPQPGGQPRREHNYGWAPNSAALAVDPSYVLEDFDSISEAQARTAGHDVLIHVDRSTFPVLVAVGESATQGGTYTYTAFHQVGAGSALRVNVAAAFWKLKVRDSKPEDVGQTTIFTQEVPS